MSVSHDTRIRSRETRALPGDLGASGGAPPLGGDMAAAGAEGGSEEAARESEAWAAAVPPVRPLHRPQLVHFFQFSGKLFPLVLVQMDVEIPSQWDFSATQNVRLHPPQI